MVMEHYKVDPNRNKKDIDSLHILNLVCHFFIITCLPQSSMVLSQGLDQVSSSLNSRKNKPLSFHMTMTFKTLLTHFLWAMLLVNIIVGQLLVQTFTYQTIIPLRLDMLWNFLQRGQLDLRVERVPYSFWFWGLHQISNVGPMTAHIVFLQRKVNTFMCWQQSNLRLHSFDR